MTSVLRVGFSEASLFGLHFRARFLLDRGVLANWFSLKSSFPWLLVLAAPVGKSVFFLAVLHFEGSGSFPLKLLWGLSFQLWCQHFTRTRLGSAAFVLFLGLRSTSSSCDWMSSITFRAPLSAAQGTGDTG